MSDVRKIKTALISVYHKDGLDDILSMLHAQGVKFLSTGGTQTFIEQLGYPCSAVEDLTSYPSILGGRVKTLHPKVFGGILNRRDNEGDRQQIAQYEIPEIDLVIVDLYPFADTVCSGADHAAIIEKIDIGGISLIRAGAKNYKDVVIVASKAQYARSSQNYLRIAVDGEKHMRYGENPHQNGTFYGRLSEVFDQVHGKEISYNNLLDIDAAINLMAEFTEPTFAILKHNNACGLATRSTMLEAWEAALAGDPVSAFGGVLIANRIIDLATAEAINKIFFEVVIAPAYDDAALEVLCQKKNRIVLKQHSQLKATRQYRSILNGALVQDKDLKVETPDDLRQATEKAVTPSQIDDLLFANKIVKHSKSNAIVLAIAKAGSFGFDLHGAVMASDAFFPFADCVEIAHQAGVDAVIQPGGSIRDQDTIDYCNANGIAMVITGIRHFKH